MAHLHGRLRKFSSYPAYKKTGVEGLEEIPVSWEVRKTTWLFTIGSGTTPSDDPTYYGGGIPWITTSELRETTINSTEKTVTERALLDFPSLKMHPKGSVAVAMYGATIGRLGILGIPATVNQACCVFSNPKGIDARFWFYWLQMRRTHLISLGYGGGQPNLSQGLLRSIRVPTPPLAEQKKITAFLDRETAKIDALVAKKERVIELLQEKRTALITRAVTRGLNSNVPMRDSGVDWLGKIPTHWELKPFTKYVIEKSDYRGKTPEKTASGVFLVTARNVKLGSIDYECSQEFVAEEEYELIMRRGLPKNGDILFTTEAPLGNVALVDREDIALAQRIIRFRMNDRQFDSRFTLFAMMSGYFQTQLSTLSTGSTAEGLKASKLPMLWLVAPPLVEQRAIREFIDRKIAKIDALVVKIENAVRRLNDFRAALISAAATGKIDVREEAA